MIAALALALTAPADPAPPLGALPRQELPAIGCAAYLWTIGPGPVLVAMARADQPILRVVIEGAVADLLRTAHGDTAALGFARSADYTRGDVTVTLDLTVQLQPDLKDGARVPTATLTIARKGQDVVVMPVAGLIGCAPA